MIIIYRELISEFKQNRFKNVYLFYGEEVYLRECAFFELQKYILNDDLKDMNYQIMDGNNVTADIIINACETLPFMCSKRLVAVRDMPYFKAKDSAGNSDLKDLIEYIPKIPDTCCLTFIITGSVNNNKLFKNVKKAGDVIEFKKISNIEMTNYIVKKFRKYNKIISNNDADYIVFLKGNGLTDINNEIDKITNYTGKRDTVTKNDIDNVITKSAEVNIFQMVDYIGGKRTGFAIKILNKMIDDGENILGILSMIDRQLRIILHVKLLKKQGYGFRQISEKLKLSSFVVSKLLKQADNFTEEQLEAGLNLCFETDYMIKTGNTDDITAINMALIKICK